MSPMASFFLFFSFLTFFFSIAKALDRAPHGLAYENPMAFSPSAFDFFHPNTEVPSSTKNSCATSNCSPLPLAAQLEATRSHPHHSSGSRQLGAGGIAGIVVGFVFVLGLAMGVYYVTITRRANMSRAISVRPDA